MLVLITYDVNTETEAGKKRLRKVAKECQNYGVRVQNSVFECVLEAAMLRKLQANLEKLIDLEKDSVRIYFLGDEKKRRVEEMGVKRGVDVEGVLIV